MALRFLLGVDVPFSNAHVAMSGEICQRPGVHVQCPPGWASVPERVKRKPLNVVAGLAGFFVGLGLPIARGFRSNQCERSPTLDESTPRDEGHNPVVSEQRCEVRV